MKRDKLFLLAFIGLLALVILVQIAGQGMLNHWRAQRAYSKPDPKEVPQPPKALAVQMSSDAVSRFLRWRVSRQTSYRFFK